VTPVTPVAPVAPAAAPLAVPTDGSADWPGFRGPDGDNVSKEKVKLSRDWGKSPPVEVWSVNDLGEGYAAPAIAAGRVFLLDYDQEKREDRARAFRLTDGAPLWTCSYPAEVKRSHGMSRTVPAVWSNVVVTFGPLGHVTAMAADSGARLWQIDLVREYGSTVPEWYAGQCPLILDGAVILAPAGSNALLLAVDALDGRVRWTAANPDRWQMSHASVLAATLAGRRMLVYPSRGGLAAVDAATGAALWTFTDWPSIIADIPTAVPIGNDRLFVARAYEQGSWILQVREEGGAFRAEPVRKLPRKVFGSDQQTPILYNGFLYGVRPPRGELVCLDPDGNEKWASGPAGRFGIGPYVVADGLLFVMNDTGTVTPVEATPEAYRPLTAKRLMDGRETWGPIVIAGGRMLLRDLRGDKPNGSRLVCYDVRER
jgi:outer membrane protein assembly factor BamB